MKHKYILSIALLSFVIPIRISAEPIDTVSVTLRRVRALSGNIDTESPADFFAKVQIGARTFDNEDTDSQNALEDRNEISPNWEFSNQVDLSTVTSIPIVIQIWDEDGGLNLDNNILDISSSVTSRNINLTLNLTTCTFVLAAASGVLTGGGTSAICGQVVSVSGDGMPSSQGNVFLEFVVDAELSSRSGASTTSGLRVICTHNPLIPNPGEVVTVTGLAVDGNGAMVIAANVVDVWFASGTIATSPPAMTSSTPAIACPGLSTCAFSNLPPPSAQFFSYGCRAAVGSQQVWSGWKTTPIGFPVGEGAVPVVRTGPMTSSIDIVFIPDANSYDGPADRNFLSDANQIIRAYYGEDVFLAKQDQLSFWVARNSGVATDSDVTGCDHAPPIDWDSQYAFADVGVILHTWETAGASETFFRDCAPAGESYVSAPVSQPRVVLHETGHTPFGLADEYCCDGGYHEADPPNIYSEWGTNLTEDCEADLPNLGRTSGCRLIIPPGTVIGVSPFTQEWSTSEPATNDLMNDNGRAQAADIRLINRLFSECRDSDC